MCQTSRQIKRGRDTKIPEYRGPYEKGSGIGGVDAQTRWRICKMTLNELTVLCTTLSKKVEDLQNDLKQTKLTYGAAYTKLILRVKKLEHKNNEEERQRIARDAKIAKQLQEEIDIASQEQEKYDLAQPLELKKELDKREEVVAETTQSHDIDWSDPAMLRYHA
ncbi:hypothetical protein Tco_1062091 [Tanacetum coccineum]